MEERSVMMIIYTDQNQCKEFGVSYFEEASWVVDIAVLLKTKDYDQQHKTLLTGLGTKSSLTLERGKGRLRPGWWCIKKILVHHGLNRDQSDPCFEWARDYCKANNLYIEEKDDG